MLAVGLPPGFACSPSAERQPDLLRTPGRLRNHAGVPTGFMQPCSWHAYSIRILIAMVGIHGGHPGLLVSNDL